MAVSFLSGELNLTWGGGGSCSGRILAPWLIGCVTPRSCLSLSLSVCVSLSLLCQREVVIIEARWPCCYRLSESRCAKHLAP